MTRESESRLKIVIFLVLVVLTLVVCTSGGDDGTPAGDPIGTESEWDEFPSGLQASVDQYARDGDCIGLQATFDTVDRADGSHPDILSYIDSKMESAGCYG